MSKSWSYKDIACIINTTTEWEVLGIGSNKRHPKYVFETLVNGRRWPHRCGASASPINVERITQQVEEEIDTRLNNGQEIPS